MPSFRPRSLSEYAQVIWRRKTLIFFVALAMLISTYFVIAGLPNVYESRASVVVAGQPDDRASIGPRVAAITERVTSRAFLESVIARNNLYPGAAERGTTERAVNDMRRNIKIETRWRGDRPETISLSYRHTNPEIAQRVAADLVSLFDGMNEAVLKQREHENEEIQAEMARLETEMSNLDQQRASAAASRSIASSVASQINMTRAERLAAQSSVETLTDRAYMLEQQIAEQQRQIAEQQKIVQAAPSDARANSSYGVLLVRKAELEAQLKDYATQYTDKNPKVTQAQTQLAEINRQIAELAANPKGAPPNSAEARELRGMKRELARLQAELEVTRRELSRKRQRAGDGPVAAAPIIASGGGGDAALPASSDSFRLRNRYDALLKKQEALAWFRAQTAGLEPGIFQIVDQPSQPQTPVGPNRSRLQLLALALSLGIGLLVAVAFEVPRLMRIRDDRDVEYYLDAPVLAMIPESLTESERGRTRRLLMARGLVLLLLLALLVPIIVIALNQLQVFQILANRG